MTDRFLKLALLCALSLPILCHGQQDQSDSKSFVPAGMTSIVNTVTIAGDPKAVFDLITTARFWPLWHPASMAVGGVTERPYGLGDKIREGAKIGSQSFHVTWTVLEHVRPSRVVLQTED
ncbi:MAG: SRPBCC family protein, partial [Gammaproteobacteria bacterium]